MTSAVGSSLTLPYSRVQLFSGGSYRFGYYLGSYAALCDHGLKPDLILATCGGSLASLLVNIAPEPKQLKTLLESKTLYDVVRASQPRKPLYSSTNKHLKPSYFYQALKRWGLMQQPARLKNIHQKETHDQLLAELQRFAMFEIDKEESWLDELVALKEPSLSKSDLPPDIAIIASRIIPAESPIEGNDRQAVAKLQEVLFTPGELMPYLNQHSTLHCPTHFHATQRIVKDIHVVDEWDITHAVRASMADMYYLQPILIPTLGWSLGGVIDLNPIELATHLGNTIFAETKAPYDKLLATPAIKRIFGFDPNHRSHEVSAYQSAMSQQNNIHLLPFADNGKALIGQYVRKRLNIRAGQIDLIHADYDTFVQQMQAQWQYGYERTTQYLKANPVHQI